ncbi:serine/threonine protein kinase [Streptomyces actinomycinicus]|uniref:non-specific serine/threonine protein kinase n=1 Tax=Streptomyces actinomycinicus TaxID=1695166 RepID=A0A937JQH7_9ACTN|nr:serine/threonine-protein kinase [Streptomyces actinomycinicus]MBL1085406.1 serine/threonine protein kinase [Streptomyces actinomycinicus]
MNTASRQASWPPRSASGLIGAEIAGYRVERELGRGGMAVVYCAKDLRLGRTVALKLLAPEYTRNEAFRSRFAQESRVAAAIDHPNIVPVFEAGEADGILYIAMCFVSGLDLRALIDREGRLTVPAALRIAAQLASALDAAHARDLVHRDVKPGNVLVAKGIDSDHPEHVYLTDFGLAKKSLSLTGFTSAGEFVGTLDYVAPERITGRPVDGRSDLYSLACVVHETLVGVPPFHREDHLELLWAHQCDQPPALSEGRPDIPAEADEVMFRALAKVPDDRYDTCMEFVSALRTAVGEVGPRGRTPTLVDMRVGADCADPGAEAEAEAARVVVPEPPAWAVPVLRGPA